MSELTAQQRSIIANAIDEILAAYEEAGNSRDGMPLVGQALRDLASMAAIDIDFLAEEYRR